jgi:hypothetical protein
MYEFSAERMQSHASDNKVEARTTKREEDKMCKSTEELLKNEIIKKIEEERTRNSYKTPGRGYSERIGPGNKSDEGKFPRICRS